MTKSMTVNQLLNLGDAVNALFEEHIKYNVNVGYRLYRLKEELNDMSSYILNRLFEVIPTLKEGNGELNDDQNLVYQAILDSPVEVETFGLTRAEIYMTDESDDLQKPLVELHFIENLEPLF